MDCSGGEEPHSIFPLVYPMNYNYEIGVQNITLYSSPIAIEYHFNIPRSQVGRQGGFSD